jgi:type VI protein secretion system component VasK
MLFIFFKDWVIWLQTTILWWVIVSLMLLVSLNWWYWTMKVIRRLLANRETEYNLIRLLILELKEIRQQVAELKKE